MCRTADNATYRRAGKRQPNLKNYDISVSNFSTQERNASPGINARECRQRMQRFIDWLESQQNPAIVQRIGTGRRTSYSWKTRFVSGMKAIPGFCARSKTVALVT
jgi:hypothetical protein